MGLPSINISFQEAGISAIQRGERGIVALILRGAVPIENPVQIYTPADIPEDASAANRKQINLALMGYQRPPRKVIAYMIGSEDDYTDAMNYLETVRWDYLAIPGIEPEETLEVSNWIKALRDTKGIKVKAVLPNMPADHEGIINITADEMFDGTEIYEASEYCARFAGLFAGTPLTIAATFAPLPELQDCLKLSKEDLDTAIDSGELQLYNDGEKIKVARAVNSLVTTTQEKGESFQKIKIVDAMDMIHDDIKKTAEDSYLGKYANSYDNKCLLISAIQGYFDQLEIDGILDRGKNSVFIDIPAQTAYLKGIGYQMPDGRTVEDMSEQEIKEANTKDKVFLAANIKILDAIEEINLPITI
ncbi:MAG: phage tail sheath C-terminal domain-containing protein [Bacillota bacterium]|nr:phage tail sheath C-terminal domain-containing protein [Bacillota bacterium]